MSWVTHEVLIIGQIVGACAYAVASYRLWRRQFDRLTVCSLSTGVALDIILAVLGATSDLVNNPDGMPWHHPLFGAAVVLATAGMLGYMLVLPLLLVRQWRAKAAAFVSYAQLVIWPSWTIGVTLFILNVFVGWFYPLRRNVTLTGIARRRAPEQRRVLKRPRPGACEAFGANIGTSPLLRHHGSGTEP